MTSQYVNLSQVKKVEPPGLTALPYKCVDTYRDSPNRNRLPTAHDHDCLESGMQGPSRQGIWSLLEASSLTRFAPSNLILQFSMAAAGGCCFLPLLCFQINWTIINDLTPSGRGERGTPWRNRSFIIRWEGVAGEFWGGGTIKKIWFERGGGGVSGEKILSIKGRVDHQKNPLYFVVMAFVILQTAYPNAKNCGTY